MGRVVSFTPRPLCPLRDICSCPLGRPPNPVWTLWSRDLLRLMEIALQTPIPIARRCTYWVIPAPVPVSVTKARYYLWRVFSDTRNLYILSMISVFGFMETKLVLFYFYFQHRNSGTFPVESHDHVSGRNLVCAEYGYLKGAPDTNS
jgi:hypothetical protein